MGAKEAKILMNNPEKEKEVRQIFKKFDTNGDGSLDKKEFKAVAKMLFNERTKFGFVDDDGERDESTVEYFANDIFDRIDVNNDNTVSFEEFWTFFKSVADGTFKRKGEIEVKDESLVVSFEISYNYVDTRDTWKYPCTICCLPCVNPVQMLNDDSKYFCRMCILTEMKIDKLEQAPIKPASQLCYDTVDSMPVRCCFAWNGCQQIMPRLGLAQHTTECPLKNFICPNQSFGCPFTHVEITHVADHSQQCQYKPVQKDLRGSKFGTGVSVLPSDGSFSSTLCRKCSMQHNDPEVSNFYHTGTFQGLSWSAFIKAREKNASQFNEQSSKKKVGEGALHFCGRVACKSACNFGHDAKVCAVASGKAGLVSAYGTTIGAVVVLGIATSPAGGVGVIAAPVIGGAVGLVIGIGGTLGGLLIGAGHACATPFIELGKAARKPTVYEEKPAVLVPWTCCQGLGSWAKGCQECEYNANVI